MEFLLILLLSIASDGSWWLEFDKSNVFEPTPFISFEAMLIQKTINRGSLEAWVNSLLEISLVLLLVFTSAVMLLSC
jgi:hypothetical protein